MKRVMSIFRNFLVPFCEKAKEEGNEYLIRRVKGALGSVVKEKTGGFFTLFINEKDYLKMGKEEKAGPNMEAMYNGIVKEHSKSSETLLSKEILENPLIVTSR